MTDLAAGKGTTRHEGRDAISENSKNKVLPVPKDEEHQEAQPVRYQDRLARALGNGPSSRGGGHTPESHTTSRKALPGCTPARTNAAARRLSAAAA
jgi:hypothetical protein